MTSSVRIPAMAPRSAFRYGGKPYTEGRQRAGRPVVAARSVMGGCAGCGSFGAGPFDYQKMAVWRATPGMGASAAYQADYQPSVAVVSHGEPAGRCGVGYKLAPDGVNCVPDTGPSSDSTSLQPAATNPNLKWYLAGGAAVLIGATIFLVMRRRAR